MNASVLKEIEGLRRLTVGGLRDKYREVFGEESRSNHKDFLFRRIAWRLQANAEGGLSERARRRALEIANDADLRIRAPKDFGSPDAARRTAVTTIRAGGGRDHRLPMAGTLLTRDFKGRTYIVKVLDDGFEYDGRQYRSLSAIAGEITGTRWNGFLFFGLTREAHVAQRKRNPKGSPGGGQRQRRRSCARARHPVRRLHAQVHRRGSGPGVQLPRRPAGSGGSLHRQPEARGMDAYHGRLQRWGVHRREHGPARPAPPAGRHRSWPGG